MEYMSRALHLAARALGTSSPNPAVGAVIAKDGEVVGEGFTQPPGRAHAEVVALEQAGSRARGATLYVTLEPCPHHGRTPPCVDAIIAAGIARVEMATIDPSPWVNGAGRAALERAGIRTAVGSMEREARSLIEGYLNWVKWGRPFVTAVYSTSLDGGAAGDGTADALGGAASAEWQRLRSRADRVLAGAESLPREGQGLTELGSAGVTTLLVECRPADVSELVSTGMVDSVVAFITPTVGGAGGCEQAAARSATAGSPTRLRRLVCERLGDDLMVVGYIRACSPDS
jgi:diaminohydroxyphosphoribosylaminopyrimidine deaminase / 5-amino-6-(5-phosphoribosylamino)uracil reductase